MRTFALLVCLVSLATPALAQDITHTAEQDTPLAMGARIGGYGFRQLNGDNNFDWFLCRMDGVGIFATYDFTPNLYAEISTDLYFATQDTLRQGIDRLSLHTVGVGGVRLLPGALISPNIHAGGGAEFTWMRVYGNARQDVVPVGFLGMGGEINYERFHFGLAIRANAMQLPEYDWGEGGEAQEETVALRTEVSGQMLFSVRYSL